MQASSKLATLAVVSSLLAACSGGSSLTPQTPSSATQQSSSTASAAGSRFISAPGPTNSQDFTYNVNPPAHPFGNGSPVTASALPPPSVCAQLFHFTCYTPAEIKTAYNVPTQYDGSGQTIVIIDAFGSPTIQQDLAAFDVVMSVPNPTLNIVYPSGQPAAFDPADANRLGWAGETSLDVEWAHAIAPKATIDLVIAPTNSGTDLGNAEAYAIQHYPGSPISMSYGAPERAIPGGGNNIHLQHDDIAYQRAQSSGNTLIASDGDLGSTDGTNAITASFPASDPSVLAVGGTALFMSDSGTYQSEEVWNDTIPVLCPFGCAYGALGATGGAPSIIFLAPEYQQALFHPASREVADVSYNASLYTGVFTVQSYLTPGTEHFFVNGGTSAGAPQWAGIIALANQALGHPVGFVNNTLYQIAKVGPYGSAFHDITNGSNGLFGGPGESAGPGYDMPTGLGSPNVANLINALRAGGTGN
jgi:subtilase family serine protease